MKKLFVDVMQLKFNMKFLNCNWSVLEKVTLRCFFVEQLLSNNLSNIAVYSPLMFWESFVSVC